MDTVGDTTNNDEHEKSKQILNAFGKINDGETLPISNERQKEHLLDFNKLLNNNNNDDEENDSDFVPSEESANDDDDDDDDGDDNENENDERLVEQCVDGQNKIDDEI